MDQYDQQIARLQRRLSGRALQVREQEVRHRQAAARDDHIRFEAAHAEADPAPDGELPFEGAFRESHNRLKARLRAGLIDTSIYEARLAAITATRQERAAQWDKHTRQRRTKASKATARMRLRAVRAHLR